MILDANKLYSCAKELRLLFTEQRVINKTRDMLSEVSNQSEVEWDALQQYANDIDHKVYETTTSLLSMWDGNHNLNTLMADKMCFIRYRIDDGIKDVMLTTVLKDRLDIVKRHLSIESDITENTLKDNLDYVKDWDAWGEYLEEINELSIQKCKEYTTGSVLESFKKPVTKDMEETQQIEESEMQVSVHAVDRYIERVLGITDPFAIKHESVHRFVQYKEKIKNMYNEAEHFYEAKGKVYKITEDNIILVAMPKDNKIMTLYEKDYGFSKEINRQIIFMQLEVIKNEKAKLDEVEKSFKEQMAVYIEEEKIYKEMVEQIQSELDKAQSKLNDVMRCKKSARSMLEEHDNRYREEYDKIFKTCKVVRIEE
ncbi:hypothetical protein [Bacillus phage SPO1L1]|nr:hypothetical protein [Bacillus phage SPO1L1]WIT26163.1 hypothetical protein [Bacillus phage SPO1L2]